MQSAYRPFHSTKSALLCVQNDILSSLNNKKMVALVLLDLSAAFDTIDHEKLLHRLETSFGINGTALDWFRSYLSNRSQAVRIKNSSSEKMYLNFGVPQGSVLGPILFTLYVAPVVDIANKHGVSHILYADDTQLYVEFNKSSMAASLQHLELCIDGIKSWMAQNILKLNEDKTEVIVFGSRKYLEGMPSISIRVGDCTITPTRSVRNLGAHFDSRMNMEEFIIKKCRACQLQLHKIARIRKYLSNDTCSCIIQGLVTSKLDYANYLLYGVNKVFCTDYKLYKIQQPESSSK